MRGQRLEFVRSGNKGLAGQRSDFLGDSNGEIGVGVKAGTDGRATLGEGVEVLQGVLDGLDVHWREGREGGSEGGRTGWRRG